MPRHKDTDWNLRGATQHADGSRTYPIETIQAALLMDIRDELKKLNTLLHCPNFTGMPATLRTISGKVGKRRSGDT